MQNASLKLPFAVNLGAKCQYDNSSAKIEYWKIGINLPIVKEF